MITLDPTEVGPVDSEHFKFAVPLAAGAYAFRVPMESPSKQGVTVALPDGSEIRVPIPDTADTRPLLVMRDHFAPDYAAFIRAAMRFGALVRIWHDSRMKKWTKPSDDPHAVLVSDAVLAVVASQPLNAAGEFDEDSFVDAVREVAAQDDDDKE